MAPTLDGLDLSLPKPALVYALRQRGFSCEDVAGLVRLSTAHTKYLYKKHAATLGEVPVGNPVTGRLAYEAKAREPDRPWRDVARELGTNENAANVGAKRYAETHALPWPIPAIREQAERVRRIEQMVLDILRQQEEARKAERNRACYDMRAAGHSWEEVRDALRLTHHVRGIEFARKAAERDKLQWPVRTRLSA